jgi:TIR domain
MTAPIPTGSGRIFISYRREDTAYPAGWLYDRLVDHFGGGQVFKDIDSIVLGDDFVDVITEAVESCDVLLALIGDEWLTVTDADGRRRIDDPDDFVRLELEAALTRSVRVIPILVDGARMPKVEELPDSLKRLVRRQALELSPSRFEFDTNRLVKVLGRTLPQPEGDAGDDAPTAVQPSPPVAVPPPEPAVAPAAQPSPTPSSGSRSHNMPLLLGIGAGVLVIIVLMVVLITRLGGSGDGVDINDAEAVSGAGLELVELRAALSNDPPQVGDTITVSFTLTNVGDNPLQFEGTFVAARNAADDNLDSDQANNRAQLAPGDSIDTQATIELTSEGNWLFWPCYELIDGSLCPDEWQAFQISTG